MKLLLKLLAEAAGSVLPPTFQVISMAIVFTNDLAEEFAES